METPSYTGHTFLQSRVQSVSKERCRSYTVSSHAAVGIQPERIKASQSTGNVAGGLCQRNRGHGRSCWHLTVRGHQTSPRPRSAVFISLSELVSSNPPSKTSPRICPGKPVPQDTSSHWASRPAKAGEPAGFFPKNGEAMHS